MIGVKRILNVNLLNIYLGKFSIFIQTLFMAETSISFSIKNWSQEDQPREKLLHKGKAALSDAELVAILIGSGSREESAVELCKRILASAVKKL